MGKAANLHVPFFQDVEQPHLDFWGQVGQLVHAEDTAMAAGNQPEVQHLFARQGLATGMLDEVDLTDQIGDRHVGSRQLFVVPLLAGNPFQRAVVAVLGQLLATVMRNRVERVVPQFRARDDGHLFVEQFDQLPEHAGFPLSPQPEEQHVVQREQPVDHLGQHGFFVPHDARKERLLGPQFLQQILPHLSFDGAALPAAGTQFADGLRKGGHRGTQGVAGKKRDSRPYGAIVGTERERVRWESSGNGRVGRFEVFRRDPLRAVFKKSEPPKAADQRSQRADPLPCLRPDPGVPVAKASGRRDFRARSAQLGGCQRAADPIARGRQQEP